MTTKKKEEQPEIDQPESTVEMRHEFTRYRHRIAIGEEWIDVDESGIAHFPARLVEAAELAGFRRT